MQYRKLRIDYVDDCVPNEGGYFCQVYRESDEAQIDEFCTHPDELVGIADPEDFMPTVWIWSAICPNPARQRMWTRAELMRFPVTVEWRTILRRKDPTGVAEA